MGGSDYSRVARAIEYLERHAGNQPTLAEVAAQVELSEFHFQRMFHRWAGVTPKAFLQALTLRQAKALLAEEKSLLDTSLHLGMSGPSRLHDLFLHVDAMTPGAFKRAGHGLDIRWGCHETPFGTALFAATTQGLCGLSFLAEDTPEVAFRALQGRWPGATWMEAPEQTLAFAEEVEARMRGAGMRPLSLVFKGSPFQVKVWEALLAVPEGHVISYGGLAEVIGSPQASRAVGTALSLNPIGYLIPCHRVIRATGAIGEYRWGGVRKQALLGVEGARVLAS